MPRVINPFNTGSYDESCPDRFIGRKREVNTILSLLAGPGRGSSAISGPERIGKTWLLHHIANPIVSRVWNLSSEHYHFLYLDSHNMASFARTGLEVGFWQYVLRDLAEYKIYTPDYIHSLLVNGFDPHDLDDLFDSIGKMGRLVILLLDEFDFVVDQSDPQIPSFLYSLRALSSRPSRGLAMVVASREPLDELCQGIRFAGSPFYNIFTFVHLGKFSREEAEELIDKYLAGTGITFDQEDREFLWQVSEKGHPYLLQVACFKLFEGKLSGEVP